MLHFKERFKTMFQSALFILYHNLYHNLQTFYKELVGEADASAD